MRLRRARGGPRAWSRSVGDRPSRSGSLRAARESLTPIPLFLLSDVPAPEFNTTDVYNPFDLSSRTSRAVRYTVRELASERPVEERTMLPLIPIGMALVLLQGPPPKPS